MKTAAWDLDGTILETKGRYVRPDGSQDTSAILTAPGIQETILEARRLTEDGWNNVVVTGRPKSTLSAVVLALDRVGFPQTRIYQPACFESLEALAWWKAGILQASGASRMTGDTWVDEVGAKHACVPYHEVRVVA